MNNMQSGHNCPVIWFPTGGVGTTLQITGHSGDWSVLLLDVTHTGTSGIRARIAGLQDFASTVNADFDLDLPPYDNPPNIVPGVQGLISVFLSAAHFNRFPVRIEKLHWQTTVESKVSYSFDVKMDAFAGAVTTSAGT